MTCTIIGTANGVTKLESAGETYYADSATIGAAGDNVEVDIRGQVTTGGGTPLRNMGYRDFIGFEGRRRKEAHQLEDEFDTGCRAGQDSGIPESSVSENAPQISSSGD